jgi:hypothetical protein
MPSEAVDVDVGQLVWMSQDFADAYNGIKADLEFHEDEGLQSFDPTAAATARRMRNEMKQ